MTSPNAGFSTAPADRLYLPVENTPDRPTVAAQRAQADSLLNCVRQLIALRQAHPALCASGAFEPVYAEAGKLPFVYKRQSGDETILVALNPSGQPCEVHLDASLSAQTPEVLYGAGETFTRIEYRMDLAVAGGKRGSVPDMVEMRSKMGIL